MICTEEAPGTGLGTRASQVLERVRADLTLCLTLDCLGPGLPPGRVAVVQGLASVSIPVTRGSAAPSTVAALVLRPWCVLL